MLCLLLNDKNYCHNDSTDSCLTLKPRKNLSHLFNMFHAKTVKSLRQKELYWYHKLKTYAPFVLNERDVYAAY